MTIISSSIPLTEVVDCKCIYAALSQHKLICILAFKIFVSAQGKQGHLGEASKQQLENIFGSSKDIVVAEKLLKEGVAQNADRLDDDHLLKNLSHGDFRMDTRGSGARTTGA